MRVLLAPTAFDGTLTAHQAAEAMAAGWRRTAPGDELDLCPLSDGGRGYLPVLESGLRRLGHDVATCPVTVTGPNREPAPALLVHDRTTRTVHLDTDSLLGLPWITRVPVLPPGGPRSEPSRPMAPPGDALPGTSLPGNPAAEPSLTETTSAGLGELLEAALDLQPRQVVVGVGQTCTHDAGAGAAAALGAEPAALLRSGGLALADLARPGADETAVSGIAEIRRRFEGIDLVAALREPGLGLLGLSGTSATTATGRGATPEQAQQLERALAQWAASAEAGLGLSAQDLLTLDLSARDSTTHPPGEHLPGQHQPGGHLPGPHQPGPHQPGQGRSRQGRFSRLPGAGAGGGLGYALALFGARLVPGAEAVAQAIELRSRIAASDLVVVGEGCFDWRSLRDTPATVVAATAQQLAVPVIVIAGQVEAGRRELSAVGLEAAYAVVDRLADLPAALADPAGRLASRTARVARTWSR